MEDLIYKTISSTLEFVDSKLQDKLISFEQRLLEQKNNVLYFIISLYEMKHTFCSKGSDWQIQKTKQGKGYYFNDFMRLHFGLSQDYIYKCCNVVKRFTDYSERVGADILVRFLPFLDGFSLSKLFELLVLTNKEIEEVVRKGQLKPEMTLKEIREFIKSYKGKTKVKKEPEAKEEVIEQSVEEFNQQVDFVSVQIDKIVRSYLITIKDKKMVEELISSILAEVKNLKK